MFRIKILTGIFLMTFYVPVLVFGQGTEKQRAMSLLQAVAEKYKTSGALHFAIRYRYATQEKPGQYLDSLNGDLKLKGDRFRYIMDSTEFIGSKQLTAILFRQDKIVYLVKPSAASQQSNPLAMLDSVLLKNDSIECTVKDGKEEKTISLSFSSGKVSKNVVYVIDAHSGLVIRMTSLVPASELYAPTGQSVVEENGKYVVVEADFVLVGKNDFSDAELEPARLYKKESGKYIPLPPFTSYKIIAATPDL